MFKTLLYMHDLLRQHVDYDWAIALQFLPETTAYNMLAGHPLIVQVKFCKNKYK